jgi:hypothetical protein
MTASSSRRRQRHAGELVALALSAALACASQQSTSVEPVGPMAAESSPDSSATPARATERGEPDATASSVVTLIAKPGLWPLDVESARRVLTALGPVKREQPRPEALSLVGGPFGALERFDVDYSLEENKYWVFASAWFFLGGRDLDRLYRTIEARLIQLLGKPASTDRDAGAVLPTVTWDLGEAILSLAPSKDRGERQLMIAIHESDDERLGRLSGPAD